MRSRVNRLDRVGPREVVSDIPGEGVEPQPFHIHFNLGNPFPHRRPPGRDQYLRRLLVGHIAGRKNLGCPTGRRGHGVPLLGDLKEDVLMLLGRRDLRLPAADFGVSLKILDA